MSGRNLLNWALLLVLTLALNLSQPRIGLAESFTLIAASNFAPFSDQNSRNGGILTEVVQTVFAKMEYETEVMFIPLKRALSTTRSKVNQAVFPHPTAAHLNEEWILSDALYFVINRFFTKADAKVMFYQPKNLEGLTACKFNGQDQTDILPWVEEGILKLEVAPQLRNCFLMMNRGRVDLVPIDEKVGWATIRQLPDEGVSYRVLRKAVQTNGLHLMIPKKAPEAQKQMEAFNAAFSALKEDGTVQTIIQKHLNQE